jgi:hypothetical protein
MLWNRLRRQLHAGEGDRPRRRLVQAGEAVEEGGLAGTVGPDQPDDLTGVHLQADVVDGLEAAELHDDVAGVEQQRALLRGRYGLVQCRRHHRAPFDSGL